MAAHMRHRQAQGFGRLIADRHSRVARATGYALTSNDDAGWWRLAIVTRARLAPAERAGFAWGVLLALDPREVREVAENALRVSEGGAGAPATPLLDLVNEAEAWAALASPRERAVYAAAAFRALGPEDRRRFFSNAARRGDG